MTLDSKRAPVRAVLSLAISIAVSTIFFVILFEEHSIDEYAGIFASLPRRMFVVYFGVTFCALIVRSLRYRLLIAASQEKDIRVFLEPLIALTGIRNIVVDLLPARLGEVLHIGLLKRYGVPVIDGASIFGVTLILDALVLFGIVLPLVLVMELWSGVGIDVNISIKTVLLIWLSACLAAAIFFRFAPVVLKKLSVWVGSHRFWKSDFLFSALSHLANSFARIANVKQLLQLIVLTLLLRGFKYGVLIYLFFEVANATAPEFLGFSYLSALIAFVSAELVASLPMSGILGFGAYEGSWVFVLAQLNGFKDEPLPLIQTAFVIHLTTQIVAVIIGSISAIYLGLRRKELLSAAQ